MRKRQRPKNEEGRLRNIYFVIFLPSIFLPASEG